jgi:hypothetical protein
MGAFLSFCADGKEIVFRSWGSNEMGLRLLFATYCEGKRICHRL